MQARSQPLEGDWGCENREQTARKELEKAAEGANRSKGTREFQSKEQNARKRLESLKTRSMPSAKNQLESFRTKSKPLERD